MRFFKNAGLRLFGFVWLVLVAFIIQALVISVVGSNSTVFAQQRFTSPVPAGNVGVAYQDIPGDVKVSGNVRTTGANASFSNDVSGLKLTPQSTHYWGMVPNSALWGGLEITDITGNNAVGYLAYNSAGAGNFGLASPDQVFKVSVNNSGVNLWGRVGVGTSTPGTALDVNGDIRASANVNGVNINASNNMTAAGVIDAATVRASNAVTATNVVASYGLLTGVNITASNTISSAGVISAGASGGTPPLQLYSAGSSNGAAVQIWTNGLGGAADLYNDITNWGGTFHWRVGSGAGEVEKMTLNDGGSLTVAGGMYGSYLHSAINDSWFPYPGDNYNYLRGNSYMNGVMYDENNPSYYIDPNNVSTFKRIQLLGQCCDPSTQQASIHFPDYYGANSGVVLRGGTERGFGAGAFFDGIPDLQANWQLQLGPLSGLMWGAHLSNASQGGTNGESCYCYTSYIAPRFHAFYTMVGDQNITRQAQINDNGNFYLRGSLQPLGSDIAENISTVAGDGVEAGDLVMSSETDKETVVKAHQDYQAHLLGIISTMPGYLGSSNFPDESDAVKNPQPLTLAGRVPTKVSTINGLVRIGDYITSSNLPGVGMRATQAGLTVGMALEEFDPAHGKGEIIPCPAGTASGVVCGKIVVFMKLSNFDPDSSLKSADGAQVNGTKVTAADGNLITKIALYAESVIGNLKAGVITAERLVVGGVDVVQTLHTQQQQIDQLKQEVEALKAAQK